MRAAGRGGGDHRRPAAWRWTTSTARRPTDARGRETTPPERGFGAPVTGHHARRQTDVEPCEGTRVEQLRACADHDASALHALLRLGGPPAPEVLDARQRRLRRGRRGRPGGDLRARRQLRAARPAALRRQILVSWALERGGLQVSVTDGGSGTRPRSVHAPSSALAGRGMAIVEVLVAGVVDRAAPARAPPCTPS